MATTTVSLDEIRRVADEVGEASDSGPVYVTRPGKSALVLLTVNEYRKLSGEPERVIETTAASKKDITFDRFRMTIDEYRKLTGRLPNLVDILAGPEGGVILISNHRAWSIINPEPCGNYRLTGIQSSGGC